MPPRTQHAKIRLTADARLALLRRQGHTLDINGSSEQVTITIRRADGQTHTLTITHNDFPETTRAAWPFRDYPQSVMINHAIHNIADWSKAQDLKTTEPS